MRHPVLHKVCGMLIGFHQPAIRETHMATCECQVCFADRPDVCYSLVATDFLPPLVLSSSLKHMAAMLAAERIAPLQCLSYKFADVAGALRQFARAQHIGKIVVHLPDLGTAASTVGCWVIFGGLGALGSLTMRWMVAQGQKHVVLLGRGGRWVCWIGL